MRKAYLSILLLSIATQIRAQSEHDSNSVITEGRRLYKSELASWNSTDLLKGDASFLALNPGGYFSYEDGGYVRSVFFNKGEPKQVITTIQYDSTVDVANAQIDRTARAFTPLEQNLLAITQATKAEIENTHFFQRYRNAGLNIIPLIYENSRKVFVMTVPANDNEVIIGNDYVITFDNENRLVEKRRIHQSMLTFPAKNKTNDTAKNIDFTYHTHFPKTGDFFTSTDICILLLYGPKTEWKYHMVIGRKRSYSWDVRGGRSKVQAPK